MKNRLLVLIALLDLSACHVGPIANEIMVAQSPGGIRADLRLASGVLEGDRLQGELLEVRGDGMLIDRKDVAGNARITFAPFDTLVSGRFDPFGSHRIRANDVELLAKLRSLSRFPQGLSDELLGKLLLAQKQQAVERLSSRN